MSDTKKLSTQANAVGVGGDPNPAPRPDRSERADGDHASRRRFLKLVAAGSAAVLASPLAAATVAEKKPVAAKKPVLPPEIQAEIKNQKDYLARTLAVIRDFELPTGSEPACVFRPLVSARRVDRGGKR